MAFSLNPTLGWFTCCWLLVGEVLDIRCLLGGLGSITIIISQITWFRISIISTRLGSDLLIRYTYTYQFKGSHYCIHRCFFVMQYCKVGSVDGTTRLIKNGLVQNGYEAPVQVNIKVKQLHIKVNIKVQMLSSNPKLCEKQHLKHLNIKVQQHIWVLMKLNVKVQQHLKHQEQHLKHQEQHIQPNKSSIPTICTSISTSISIHPW